MLTGVLWGRLLGTRESVCTFKSSALTYMLPILQLFAAQFKSVGIYTSLWSTTDNILCVYSKH